MAFLDFLNPLKPLTDGLNTAFANYLNAKNDAEKLKAEAEIEWWKTRVEAVNVSQADKPWSPRGIMGYCAAIVVVKLLVIDTVLKLDVTPDPGPTVTLITMTIVGFYFVSKAAEKVADSVASAISSRRR